MFLLGWLLTGMLSDWIRMGLCPIMDSAQRWLITGMGKIIVS